MKLRFIEYDGEIMVVIGYAYDDTYDPPECYVAMPLRNNITKTVLTTIHTVKVPFSKAEEITSMKRIKALLVLYGR